MHIFNQEYEKYIEKGLSVIPDKFMSKQPAIKGWSDYCYKLPTREELNNWCTNLEKTNIAVCLGEASQIIALDLDTDDEQLLNILLPLLPKSPVEKQGNKGFTRFFRYKGESTQIVKFNGECILEVLSNGKKTTLPPSIHPNGSAYVWTTEKTLINVSLDDLPLLPPFLVSNIENRLATLKPDAEILFNGKISSGRNNNLSQLCGSLISNQTPLEESINQLIKYDAENHEIPLFSDSNEMRHTEVFSNALNFYSNHLCTVNTKHFRKNEQYEKPISTINAGGGACLGKLVAPEQQKPKRLSLELLPARSVIRSIISNILNNSYIKQPELALGATLSLMSTLCSRKFVFQGTCSNLYVLNVSPSSSGKNLPMDKVKEILIDLRAEKLLGAGDYVSEAALMDSLGIQNVRLDIMDEAGGILRTVNSGKSEYNSKMADVLAELYTSSNSKFLGRATAEGRKGACHRPNVNILASTTPKGFQEGVSNTAIEKGLMGRFLVFEGSIGKASRIKENTRLDAETIERLKYILGLQYSESHERIGGISQQYYSVKATEEANEELDRIFEEFDLLRTNSDPNDKLLPIIGRLYQQTLKICLISSVSRLEVGNSNPKVNKEDVLFSEYLIKYYFETIKQVCEKYIHENNQDAKYGKILNILKNSENGLTKAELLKLTKEFKKREREELLMDLIDMQEISVVNCQDRNDLVYRIGI